MHRLPCAIHPANHALVQELSLVAALLKEQRSIPGSPTTPSQLPYGEVQDQLFLRAARAVAQSPAAMEETLAYPKGYGIGKVWRDIQGPAERWVRSRLRAEQQDLQQHWRRWKKWKEGERKGEEVSGAALFSSSSSSTPSSLLCASHDSGGNDGRVPSSCMPLQPSSFTHRIPTHASLSARAAPQQCRDLLFHSPFDMIKRASWTSSPRASSSFPLEEDPTPRPTSPIGRLLQHVFPFLRYIPPLRLIAQHGPSLFLPREIPHYLRDTITYEEACRHRALLQAHLCPEGFQVEMTGAFRRGAPSAPMVSFVIAYTPERVAALCENVDAVQGETLWKVPRGNTEEQRHDTLLDTTQQTCRTTLQERAARLCAISPAVDPLLRRPIERALEGLARRGYIVAGKRLTLPHRTPTASLRREAASREASSGATWSASTTADAATTMVEVVTRVWSEEATVHATPATPSQPTTLPMKEEEACLDFVEATAGHQGRPTSPRTYERAAEPPPRNITDPADLLDVRLHTVRLYFVPVNLFFLQLFFLTGPSSFTALVTMKALERGKSLYAHGLFRDVPCCGTTAPPAPSSASSSTLPGASRSTARSRSAGAFTTTARTTIPTSQNTLSQTSTVIPVTSEDVIFEAAGIRSSSSSFFIHPFLRGIYNQFQKH